MESGSYPPGAEYDSDAPYNQTELPEKEIEVTVSITLSKTVKVVVNDYRIETDEYGRFLNYDFSECDITQAVKDQIVLPQNTEEFKDWDVDDLECIIDD